MTALTYLHSTAIMLWFFLSLTAAVSIAARDVSIKTYQDLSPVDIAILELLGSVPYFAAGCYLVDIPPLDQTFWLAFIVSIPINILAYGLYLYAIKTSPLSLTIPFLAFTPVFMILTGFLILSETVNLWGGLGIGLIVLGGYILHFTQDQKSLWTPVISFLHEKGSWLMLVVALLYSFAAVIGKKAIIHSSPLFFSYLFFLVFNLIILTGLAITHRSSWQKIRFNSRRGLWLGTLLMVHITFHGLAIAISTAVYMVAVKRSSILFSVLLSWLVLKEADIRYRSLGALLMFGGILFITLLG